MWANHNLVPARSLVLLYPLLDFRQRLLETKSWWDGTAMNTDSTQRLQDGRPLRHVPRMQMSRALINEAALFDAEMMLNAVDLPALIVHGTNDAIIDHAISAELAELTGVDMESIDGADHGFSKPGDTRHESAETRALQQQAFDVVTQWIAGRF